MGEAARKRQHERKITAMIIGSKSCRSCEFLSRKDGQMYCCRYPPTPFCVMQPNGQGGMTANIIAAYPPVNPDMPCGEYKRNEINAAEELLEASTAVGVRQ